MFELKSLSLDAENAALDKAIRYRLLNEPGTAESICLDILKVDPGHQDAIITLVLAMSDRFSKDYAIGDSRIKDYLAQIKDEYKRTYYTGIVLERRAKATLRMDTPGSDSSAFNLFKQAMDWFEKAEAMRPAGNDESILRWNGCARVIMANNLEPREMASDMIE